MPKPERTELARINAFYDKLFSYLPDPDEIRTMKNVDYDEILDSDSEIRSCIGTRKNAVAKWGIDVLPYVELGAKEPKRADIKAALMLKKAIYRLSNLRGYIGEILNSYVHGFSVTEIMWGDEGRDGNYNYPVELKNRRVSYFQFGANGELYFCPPGQARILMPPRKFIVHTFDSRYCDPHGTSLLKTAYWPHWFKHNLTKLLLVYAERFGTPLTVGNYPRGTDDKVIDVVLAALQKLQTDSYAALPEGSSVNLLEATKDSGGMFRDTIMLFDAQIDKIILGQTLTTNSGQGNGSFALGKVHNEVREDIADADCADLSACLDKYLGEPLCYFNLPNVVNRPRIVIPYKAPEDLDKEAGTLEKLVKIGAEVPSSHVNERFKIPKPEEGEEILRPPQQATRPIPDSPEKIGGGDQENG